MAKGQVRSNRETRKPKKDRSAVSSAAPAAPGTQVKMASSNMGSDKKK
jgi:hypothetical protein